MKQHNARCNAVAAQNSIISIVNIVDSVIAAVAME
jgi:hypothetical protein